MSAAMKGQLCVLYVLLEGGWISASLLRNRLNRGKWFWEKWGIVSFFHLMAMMQDQGVVEWKEEVHGLYPVKERYYRLKVGVQAVEGEG